MSPHQPETAIAGLCADDIGDVIGRTLDHLRWVSILALFVALGLQEARDSYGLVLLLGAVVVAGLVAVWDVCR